jgi:hypothetical protein
MGGMVWNGDIRDTRRKEERRGTPGRGNKEIFECLLLQRNLTKVARRFIVGHIIFFPRVYSMVPTLSGQNKNKNNVNNVNNTKRPLR